MEGGRTERGVRFGQVLTMLYEVAYHERLELPLGHERLWVVGLGARVIYNFNDRCSVFFAVV
jgi:hypothetical protein